MDRISLQPLVQGLPRRRRKELHLRTASLYNLWYKDYLDGEGKNYTYSTTNFVVTKDISKSTQIYAGVDNIFDKTFSDDDDYSIYGRTWRTGVTFKF